MFLLWLLLSLLFLFLMVVMDGSSDATATSTVGIPSLLGVFPQWVLHLSAQLYS
jgi:hypothetical protein